METSKKLEAERKRFAHETELREIVEFKKKRLENAPINDLSSALFPDYKSPFSCLADAWQRLLPYHVLLPKDKNNFSANKWDVEVESLCGKYRNWRRALKDKFSELCELEDENVSAESAGLGTGVLNVDDCVVMEQVLLEDVYESVRKEKALAERKAEKVARQQAMELNARKLAEQSLAKTEIFGAQGPDRSFVPDPGRQPEYSTNMYGVSMSRVGVQPSSQPPRTLPQIPIANSFDGVGTSVGIQREDLTGRGSERASRGTSAYHSLNFDLSQRAVAGSLPRAGRHVMSHLDRSGYPGIQQVGVGVQQFLQGTGQPTMPYPAALKSVPSSVQVGGHVTLHNQRHRDLLQSDNQMRQLHQNSVVPRPSAILQKDPGGRSEAMDITSHSWLGEDMRFHGPSDGSASRQGSPLAIISAEKTPMSVGTVTGSLKSSRTVQAPVDGQASETVPLQKLVSATNNAVLKGVTAAARTGLDGHNAHQANLSRSTLLKREGASTGQDRITLNTPLSRSNKNEVANTQRGMYDIGQPGSPAGAEASSPVNGESGHSGQTELQNQNAQMMAGQEASRGLLLQQKAQRWPMENSGKVRAMDNGASPLDANIMSEKRSVGNGILPSPNVRPLRTSTGMPDGPSEASPIAGSSPVSAAQNESKEKRGMGMGSLLNSEGG